MRTLGRKGPCGVCPLMASPFQGEAVERSETDEGAHGGMRLTSAPSSVICSANATFPPVGGRQRPAPSEKFPAANFV